MADKPSSPPEQPPQPLSEETARELIALQKQQLAVRFEEVKRDSAGIDLSRSLAQQSIDAEERDRKHDREELTKRQKARQNFVLIALVLILVFSGYAMHAGPPGLVLDLVKVVMGFIGGMGYAALRSRSKRDEE